MSSATDRPFFSLVVPTYNRAHLLVPTLQSLLNQDYDHYEILVVDDGSTDNTEEVIQPLLNDRLRYYKKDNAERGAARNYGSRLAQGEYICFFDSDDLALPNHLTEAAAMVARHHSPEVFHLAYEIRTPEGQLQMTFKTEGNTVNHKLTGGNLLSCNGVFVRRDVALALPFIEDRGLSASEDWELWLRLAARYPFYTGSVITSTIVNHDQRSVVTSNKEKLLNRARLMIHYLKQDAVFVQKLGRYLRAIRAHRYLYVALHLAITGSHKWDTLKYWLKSFFTYPGVARARMFYGTLKHLLLTWR